MAVDFGTALVLATGHGVGEEVDQWPVDEGCGGASTSISGTGTGPCPIAVRKGHTVAMVGDGSNDAPAPALASAGVGIGIGIGMDEYSSHVVLETADIALANDLRQAAAVVELSRHTLRVARQNHGLSIGVTLVGLLAGACGSLNPVAVALLHNTSSIAVGAYSTCLVNHTPRPPAEAGRLRAAPIEGTRVR
jgi:cation-transporting P-type ATPase C